MTTATAQDIITAYQCPECEVLFDEEPDADPWYVCGGCGSEWARSTTESNRCEECHRFAAREFDTSCPDCGQGIEGFAEVEAILNEEGDLQVRTEWEAERAEAAKDAAAQAAFDAADAAGETTEPRWRRNEQYPLSVVLAAYSDRWLDGPLVTEQASVLLARFADDIAQHPGNPHQFITQPVYVRVDSGVIALHRPKAGRCDKPDRERAFVITSPEAARAVRVEHIQQEIEQATSRLGSYRTSLERLRAGTGSKYHTEPQLLAEIAEHEAFIAALIPLLDEAMPPDVRAWAQEWRVAYVAEQAPQ